MTCVGTFKGQRVFKGPRGGLFLKVYLKPSEIDMVKPKSRKRKRVPSVPDMPPSPTKKHKTLKTIEDFKIEILAKVSKLTQDEKQNLQDRWYRSIKGGYGSFDITTYPNARIVYKFIGEDLYGTSLCYAEILKLFKSTSDNAIRQLAQEECDPLGFG